MIDALAYQLRIGHSGDLEPTLPVLRSLHLAHLRSVPFENLDIHLGRRIVLDEERLFDKVVRRRRGGFCYELNGLFASLLREIGFDVTMLGAHFSAEDEELPPYLDHLALLVRCQDEPELLLADVASGRGGFAYPLRASFGAIQTQPEAGASFRLMPEGDGCRVWRTSGGGEWEREYRFTFAPRAYADFESGCTHHQTSPDSLFTQDRLVTLMTERGRFTLSGQRLISTVDGERTERDLDDAACTQALRDLFNIDLDLVT